MAHTEKQRHSSDAVYGPAASPALRVAQLRDEDAALMLDCLCISDLLCSPLALSLSLCSGPASGSQHTLTLPS